MNWPQRASSLNGNEFYYRACAMKWKERDSLVFYETLSGNDPSFLKKYIPVHVSITDSVTYKKVKAVFYVSPDYLSIGSDDGRAGIHITPDTK